MSSLRPSLALAAAFLVPALAGCDSSSDDEGFVLRTTTHASSPAAPLVVEGLWMVYLASESFNGPAGTDLNGDADTLDDVAVAVDLYTTVATVLSAARGAAIVGQEIYLIVDEAADGFDWSGANGATETVLLHWSTTAATRTFVDVLNLETGEALWSVGGRLYYSSATPLLVADESSLRYVASAAPTTPVAVQNAAGAGALEAHILTEEDGVIFCRLDEVANAVDLDADGDATDGVVLALLDGTVTTARLENVELALASDSAPFAVHSAGTGDWLVAFLVDETAQGGTNLNLQGPPFTQPLLPESCAGTPDTDTNDQILHYLEFSGVPAVVGVPVNTGLVGDERVLAYDGFVATVSSEADSNCDLNEDGDTTDEVARWVETTLPVAPERDAALMHALETSIPGGSHGLSLLSGRLVAVVDEADDELNIDGKLPDHDLVGWIDPLASTPAWDFAHQHPTVPSYGTGVFDSDGDPEPFAGTSWMAAEAVGGRLGLTFLEAVPGTNPDVGSLNTNLNCGPVAKDTDKTDALPIWADFQDGPTLDFDGMGYSVDAANAGIQIASAYAFFRVSEVDDNRDYNADGQKNDVVLFRNPLTTCGPVAMATSSTIVSQVITTDGVYGGAFLSSETQAGIDFNADGDTTDLVVRYFLF